MTSLYISQAKFKHRLKLHISMLLSTKTNSTLNTNVNNTCIHLSDYSCFIFNIKMYQYCLAKSSVFLCTLVIMSERISNHQTTKYFGDSIEKFKEINKYTKLLKKKTHTFSYYRTINPVVIKLSIVNKTIYFGRYNKHHGILYIYLKLIGIHY